MFPGSKHNNDVSSYIMRTFIYIYIYKCSHYIYTTWNSSTFIKKMWCPLKGEALDIKC